MKLANGDEWADINVLCKASKCEGCKVRFQCYTSERATKYSDLVVSGSEIGMVYVDTTPSQLVIMLEKAMNVIGSLKIVKITGVKRCED